MNSLYKSLGYTFKSEDLLSKALTHRSLGSKNNERLEFLGDSILNFLVAAYLYRQFPQLNEGDLSRLRASIVKGETLADVARQLQLSDFLQLGSGELKSGGFRRSSILADALEAILGAIYLESGVDAVEQVIVKIFSKKLSAIDPNLNIKDPKTQLQELLQSRKLALPSYSVEKMEGEEHQRHFVVECQLSAKNECFLGEGSSRRKAEQDAASHALLKLSKGFKIHE